MWLLTKELALAVVKACEGDELSKCPHCGVTNYFGLIEHKPECIVTRAKLLLAVEYGVQSQP